MFRRLKRYKNYLHRLFYNFIKYLLKFEYTHPSSTHQFTQQTTDKAVTFVSISSTNI